MARRFSFLPIMLAAGMVIFLLIPSMVIAQDRSDAIAQDRSHYLQDFEFIKETAEKNFPCFDTKEIDWEGALARLRPRFRDCDSDLDHVKNVMLMLAVLQDGHTCVIRSSVDRDQLPGLADGLHGGGLWMAWDQGFMLLQGMMEGHPLEEEIPLGSALVNIQDEPAWLTMAMEQKRITTWRGISTEHGLFATLGNRFFPFHGAATQELLFLTPGGKTRKAGLNRWGPGGKAFSPTRETLPPGVAWQEGAAGGWIEVPWCERLAYLRITGNMDEPTARAFHAALDQLGDLEALILDCRSMGGGGDEPAWSMVGRFFSQGVDYGILGDLPATGPWQFDGPLVLLQDEAQVSSAETFTWTLSETGRGLSVGRNTGGWTIVPLVFKCPSGLVDFRMGIKDRETVLEQIRPEGVGWPPDLHVPYGPVICAVHDPVMEVGLDAMRLLHAGVPRKKIVDTFQDLFAGRITAFEEKAPRLSSSLKDWKYERLARMMEEDLEARIDMETALLKLDACRVPDALGAARRLETLEPMARAAGMKGAVSRLAKIVKRLKGEALAQEAFLKIHDPSLPLEEDQRKAYLKEHGKTRTGRYLKDHLWK